jgi:hypothetical protein
MADKTAPSSPSAHMIAYGQPINLGFSITQPKFLSEQATQSLNDSPLVRPPAIPFAKPYATPGLSFQVAASAPAACRESAIDTAPAIDIESLDFHWTPFARSRFCKGGGDDVQATSFSEAGLDALLYAEEDDGLSFHRNHAELAPSAVHTSDQVAIYDGELSSAPDGAFQSDGGIIAGDQVAIYDGELSSAPDEAFQSGGGIAAGGQYGSEVGLSSECEWAWEVAGPAPEADVITDTSDAVLGSQPIVFAPAPGVFVSPLRGAEGEEGDAYAQDGDGMHTQVGAASCTSRTNPTHRSV